MRKSRSQCSFKFRISKYWWEDRDYNDFFNFKNETYAHKFRIFTQNIWKKIISKNFDVKKRTRVRNSKFKSANNANRISSSKFETSNRLHRETSNFDLQLAKLTFRISHEYSCAKICEFVQFNKLIVYIYENLQDS